MNKEKQGVSEVSEEEAPVIREKLMTGLLETLLDKKYAAFYFPLLQVKEQVQVVAFPSDFWNDKGPMEFLQLVLAEHKIKEVYMVPEFNPVIIIEDFISDSGLLEEDEDGYILPYYSEAYFFDQRKDWLIYTSHEATITFAGDWIVQKLTKKYSTNIVSKK